MLESLFDSELRLIQDLELAIEKVSKRSGGYSGELLPAEEFKARLTFCVDRLKQGDRSALQELWGHFAPTCAWDNFVGEAEVGERIFQRIDHELQKEQTMLASQKDPIQVQPTTTTRSLHYFSGLLITAFVGIHLFNHAWAVFGAQAHIEMMKTLRLVYRNPLVEAVLLGAVMVQMVSGLKLIAAQKKRPAMSGFDKLHLWSGLYLAVFFLIHVGAVLGGRLVLDLDTNFYFGVAGLNTFPFNLFFAPYYGLAVLAFFGHVAAVHQKKMNKSFLGLSPNRQALLMLASGLLMTAILFYGLTNRFRGVAIPAEYGVLIGK
jgi:hypothetical protein